METGNTETNATESVETKTQKQVLFRVLESVTSEDGFTKTTSAMQTTQGCVVEVTYTHTFKLAESEDEHTDIQFVSSVFVPAVKIVEAEDGSFILS